MIRMPGISIWVIPMSTSRGLTLLKRRLKAFLSRHEAIILTYHSILPPSVSLFPIAHHLGGELFEEHMRYLAEGKFNCVSLGQLAEYISSGEVPPRTVVVTFDDGFFNNYSVAYPILQRYGVPATIFLAEGFIGGRGLAWPERIALLLSLNSKASLQLGDHVFPVASEQERVAAYRAIARHFSGVAPDGIETAISDLLAQAGLDIEQLYSGPLYEAVRFMGWNEVTEMASAGLVQFGSHTISHRRLVYLTPEEARKEIADSRKMLESRVGVCDAFAYPHGRRGKDFESVHAEMAKDAGYRVVLTADTGSVTRQSDVLELPRISILNDCSIDHFEYLMLGGASFESPRQSKSVLRGVVSGQIG